MVDYSMYKRLHPPAHMHMQVHPGELEESWMDEMPEDTYLACLPPIILGFDFSKKSWSR